MAQIFLFLYKCYFDLLLAYNASMAGHRIQSYVLVIATTALIILKGEGQPHLLSHNKIDIYQLFILIYTKSSIVYKVHCNLL